MIVDASVVLKWLVIEPDSPSALGFLASTSTLGAPSILPIEVGYVLIKRVHRKQIEPVGAGRAWASFRRMELKLIDEEVDRDAAFLLALQLGVNLYGCLYLALADRTDDLLVTADESFARAVRASAHLRLRARVRLLSEVVGP